ncbi:VENN motif pre-toxin domain-containing protein [Gilliamella sp. G0441]|uniref:VENN motif pre-toxin domain-containing protein n=1 Tax=Gilliamella sp. G0441 TaxID=3384760 RepID=UPI003D333CE5
MEWGSDVSKGIDSAISIVTGIITGDITGGLAGASAPWVAEQIKKHTGHKEENGNWQTDDVAGNLIAHAILGAVVAELQGNSGLAGGAGAVTGELAADIIRKHLYGKDVKDLTEAEKENISALAQLATGLAVASVVGDVGDVSTGIAAGKNSVENNYLHSPEAEEKRKLVNKSRTVELTEAEFERYMELVQIDYKRDKDIIDNCFNGSLGNEACMNVIVPALKTKYSYEGLHGQSGVYYSDALLYPQEYQKIKNLLGDIDYDVLNYEKRITEYLRHNPNKTRADAEAHMDRAFNNYWGNLSFAFAEMAGALSAAKIHNVKTPTAGKGTGANKPLDKTALETQHGK